MSDKKVETPVEETVVEETTKSKRQIPWKPIAAVGATVGGVVTAYVLGRKKASISFDTDSVTDVVSTLVD
jgi:hypothetical protein